MKLFLLIGMSLFFNNCINAQKRFVYYFDGEMNPSTKQNAAITGQGIKTETGVKVNFFTINPRILINTCDYQDSSLAVINGQDIIYYENGKMKQSDTYEMNVINGATKKWDSTGLLTDSIIYSNEKMLNKTRYEYDFAGKLNRKIFTDSVKNIYTDIFLGASGNKTSEVNFTGNKGVWKYYNTDGSVSKTENITTREKKDAGFPGGEEAFKDYLAKELNATLPFENKAPQGEYIVLVSFTVDKDGNLSNIMPMTKQGYGMEEEAVRVIQKSGKWTPATLYGKIIKSNRLQPIQFVVTKPV